MSAPQQLPAERGGADYFAAELDRAVGKALRRHAPRPQDGQNSRPRWGGLQPRLSTPALAPRKARGKARPLSPHGEGGFYTDARQPAGSEAPTRACQPWTASATLGHALPKRGRQQHTRSELARRAAGSRASQASIVESSESLRPVELAFGLRQRRLSLGLRLLGCVRALRSGAPRRGPAWP
jgi:hypothetical protein